ncbi:hypothetical protein J2S90_000037 [Arthrobacter bambusae]|uniref:Uncharacterized protein n=1 Tax=Arthrobacter bambusae TaxID=1338426 RepID=A0AAW8D4R0_9MICC|nr:hypothetical protein [Arthrobacter bambusae]MDQ0128909.1 hypothetical protein [Arthrobacter bambusae]MDQ0180250.1 hypothetical protein [Arthrobacter bambusae]
MLNFAIDLIGALLESVWIEGLPLLRWRIRKVFKLVRAVRNPKSNCPNGKDHRPGHKSNIERQFSSGQPPEG